MDAYTNNLIMSPNKEAFKIISNFYRELFSSPPIDVNKKILFERTAEGELLINGKPSVYKQIIKEK